MIKLTRYHWSTGKIIPQPLYVQASQIVWMERTAAIPMKLEAEGLVNGEAYECTAVSIMGGFNFKVVETPDEIVAMIRIQTNGSHGK